MTEIVLEHTVQVVAGDPRPPWVQGPICYRAECECGWASHWFADNDAAAEQEGIDHREVAVRAPDDTDILLGELLAIHDDIATAVTWLADHWPADLPALDWSGYGHQGSDRPALRLGACCLDPDEFARAAELLGVTAIDDERPNPYGDRYRRVRRRFGHHVEVEVITVVGAGDGVFAPGAPA